MKRPILTLCLAVALMAPASAAADFTNGDFEMGTFAGWTKTHFLNNGLKCCAPFDGGSINRSQGGEDQSIILGTGVDPILGNSLSYPKFGTYAARVNGPKVNKLSSSILQQAQMTTEDIDPLDGLIHVRFAFAPVLESPGHSDIQQPWFYIAVHNVTQGGVKLFERFVFSNQPGVPWKQSPGPDPNAPVLYTDWQVIDLAPPPGALAVGDTIELEAIAADCALGGHFGYVYVDAFGSQLPGLSVVKTGPATVEQGDMMTYDLVYRNHGDVTVAGVVVTETLPDQTSFVAASDPRCAHAAGIVTCTLGTLDVDDVGTIHITVAVSPKATGTITNGNYSIHGNGVGKIFGPPVVTAVTPRTCMDLVMEKRLCATDGSGDFTVTFQIRNRSLKALHHLFLMPDDSYTVSPDYFNFAIQPTPAIPYPRPIPPGALSGPLTVTVKDAAPGPVNLGLIGLDEFLDGCCTVEKVVTLPTCDCAQITQITPACRNLPANPPSFNLDFTLQNLTTRTVSQILIAPPKPGLEFEKNRFDVTLPQEESVKLSIHARGNDAASNPVCFRVSLRSDTCVNCCSIEQCVTPGFCNFLSHKPLGGAKIFLSPLQVVVGNLGSTGDDGVAIDFGQLDGLTAVWSDPEAVGAPADGARLIVGATGSVAGQSGRSLGTLEVKDTGEKLAVTADFASLGASGYHVEVYRVGALVRTRELAGDGGPVGTTGAWPTRGGYVRQPNGKRALVLGIDSGFWRFEDGQEVKGDELRVIPSTDAEIGSLGALTLRAADIPTLVIVDEILGGIGPDAARGLFFSPGNSSPR